MRLVFVYNAGSGKLTGLIDAGHKLLSPGTYACNLCRLTHGAIAERRVWKEFRERSAVEMVFLHRDEFEKQFPERFDYPVVLKQGDGLDVLLTTEELDAIAEPEALIALIEARAV